MIKIDPVVKNKGTLLLTKVNTYVPTIFAYEYKKFKSDHFILLLLKYIIIRYQIVLVCYTVFY